MPVKVKICGINSPASAIAAARGGAAFVGLVFYPPSPRFVTPLQAAEFAQSVPPEVGRVGLFVDPEEAAIKAAIEAVPLDFLQFHGDESPERVAALKRVFRLPVIKALKVRESRDLDLAERYFDVADWLLFDAAPPPSLKASALPGGNALSFDWRLLSGRVWPLPWMLSGGLCAANLEQATRISGAAVADVSSGVEDRRGHKDPARILAFLAAAAEL
jgi:phosphoribosylanthranilate isomerase